MLCEAAYTAALAAHKASAPPDPTELLTEKALAELAAHSALKTTKKPFPCPHCGATATSAFGMQYHLKNRVCLRRLARSAALAGAGGCSLAAAGWSPPCRCQRLFHRHLQQPQ